MFLEKNKTKVVNNKGFEKAHPAYQKIGFSPKVSVDFDPEWP
ncbi:hypothetical protein ACFQDE_18855 [Deinococcus caeni]